MNSNAGGGKEGNKDTQRISGARMGLKELFVSLP
jgi:hypothetical protein